MLRYFVLGKMQAALKVLGKRLADLKGDFFTSVGISKVPHPTLLCLFLVLQVF